MAMKSPHHDSPAARKTQAAPDESGESGKSVESAARNAGAAGAPAPAGTSDHRGSQRGRRAHAIVVGPLRFGGLSRR